MQLCLYPSLSAQPVPLSHLSLALQEHPMANTDGGRDKLQKRAQREGEWIEGFLQIGFRYGRPPPAPLPAGTGAYSVPALLGGPVTTLLHRAPCGDCVNIWTEFSQASRFGGEWLSYCVITTRTVCCVMLPESAYTLKCRVLQFRKDTNFQVT